MGSGMPPRPDSADSANVRNPVGVKCHATTVYLVWTPDLHVGRRFGFQHIAVLAVCDCDSLSPAHWRSYGAMALGILGRHLKWRGVRVSLGNIASWRPHGNATRSPVAQRTRGSGDCRGECLGRSPRRSRPCRIRAIPPTEPARKARFEGRRGVLCGRPWHWRMKSRGDVHFPGRGGVGLTCRWH